jgi:hypothetical protein
VVLDDSGGTTGGSASLQTPAGQSLTLNDTGTSVVLQGLGGAVLSAQKVFLNGASSVVIRAGATLNMMVGQTLISALNDGSLHILNGNGASLVISAAGEMALMSAGRASVSVENSLVQLSSPGGTGLTVEDGKISVSGAQLAFNTGSVTFGMVAGYPVVMLTPQFIDWVLYHTHTHGNDNAPTGPPIPLDPLFPRDSASTRVQTT